MKNLNAEPRADLEFNPARAWQRRVGPYARARNLRATIEFGLTLSAVVIAYAVGVTTLASGSWLGLSLIPALALCLVRLFVIQHDCGHYSFFSAKRTNDIAGRICSLFTLFPYAQWRNNHARHHAHVGNLALRGVGDVSTITVHEYENSRQARRFAYRVYRHPIALVGLGGAYYTLLRNRLPRRGDSRSVRIQNIKSSQGLNFAVVAGIVTLLKSGLLEPTLMLAVPSIALGGSLGIAFFFVGHQFEETYWESPPKWKLADAAFFGSSYLALPEPFGWITGYVGIHHVHHLNSRIPFYNLPLCLDANPALQEHNRLTAIDATRSFALALWDEDRRRLADFKPLSR